MFLILTSYIVQKIEVIKSKRDVDILSPIEDSYFDSSDVFSA